MARINGLSALHDNGMRPDVLGTVWYRGEVEFAKKGLNPYFAVNSWTSSRNKIERGEDLWDDSIYHELAPQLTNDLNPCYGIAKGINRLFNLVTDPKDVMGYVAYNKKTNELWVKYYDGDMGDWNAIVDGDDSFIEKKYIMMYGHRDIESAYVINEETGFISDYIIGKREENPDAHSAAAYLMYKFCYYLYIEENPKISSMWRNIYYTNNIYRLTNSLSEVEFNNFKDYITRLENDIWTKVLLDEVNQKMYPPNNGDMAKNSFLSDDTIKIGIVNYIGTAPNTKTLKKVMRVADYVKDKTFFVVQDEELTEEQRRRVPKNVDDIIPDEAVINIIKSLTKFKKRKRALGNALFKGEAGTGKSFAARIIARLMNLPIYTVSCSANKQESDILGDVGYDENNEIGNIVGEVFNAIDDIGVVFLDEVNLLNPAVAPVFNPILSAEKEMVYKNKLHTRSENCVFVGAYNVNYAGTKSINQAFQDRFMLKYTYELPEKKVLIERLSEDVEGDVSKETIKKVVEACEKIRQKLRDVMEENGKCGYRQMQAWVYAIDALGEDHIIDAAEITVIPDSSEEKEVQSDVELIIKNYFKG